VNILNKALYWHRNRTKQPHYPQIKLWFKSGAFVRVWVKIAKMRGALTKPLELKAHAKDGAHSFSLRQSLRKILKYKENLPNYGAQVFVLRLELEVPPVLLRRIERHCII